MEHVESTNAFAVRVPAFGPKLNGKIRVSDAPAPSVVSELALPVCPQRNEALRSQEASRRKLLARVCPLFLMTTVSEAAVPVGPLLGETVMPRICKSGRPTTK